MGAKRCSDPSKNAQLGSDGPDPNRSAQLGGRCTHCGVTKVEAADQAVKYPVGLTSVLRENKSKQGAKGSRLTCQAGEETLGQMLTGAREGLSLGGVSAQAEGAAVATVRRGQIWDVKGTRGSKSRVQLDRVWEEMLGVGGGETTCRGTCLFPAVVLRSFKNTDAYGETKCGPSTRWNTTQP